MNRTKPQHQLQPFGQIGEWRVARDLSTTQAAEESGITREYWRMIERGRVWPSLPVLIRVARTLSCEPIAVVAAILALLQPAPRRKAGKRLSRAA